MLARLSTVEALSSPDLTDVSDPIILDILSENLSLPYADDIKDYLPLSTYPITVSTLKLAYDVGYQKIATIATGLSDIRLVTSILDMKVTTTSNLCIYVKRLSTLLILEKYGHTLGYTDFNTALSNIRPDNLEWMNYVIDNSIGLKYSREHFLSFIHRVVHTLNGSYLPSDKSNRIFRKVIASFCTPQVTHMDISPTMNVSQVQILYTAGYMFRDDTLNQSTKKGCEEIFIYLVDKLGYVPDTKTLSLAIADKNIQLALYIVKNYDTDTQDYMKVSTIAEAVNSGDEQLVFAVCHKYDVRSIDFNSWDVDLLSSASIPILKVLASFGKHPDERALNHSLRVGDKVRAQWLVAKYPNITSN